jgi:hypothetical protein
MENGKLQELEKVLQKMLQSNAKVQPDQNNKPLRMGTGSVIRRRKGEADKRILVSEKKQPAVRLESSEAY